MEELINKPDNQFENILNDLIDYSKDSVEKSALIKEVCHDMRPVKPAASLNSSIYSSAASDSSTSSTLSSPSQSTQSNNESSNNRLTNHGHDSDSVEVPRMEELGKTARIIEHRLAISSELNTNTNTNGVNLIAGSSTHSDKRSNRLNGKSTMPSSSTTLSQMVHHQSNPNNHITVSSSIENNITNWITINKRDKRRKRPAEQPVLSEHIPGHKGEQEVDWLVNFIESGPAGVSNISNNQNKKVTKNNNKVHSKKQSNQAMEHDREANSRKSNQKPTTTQTKQPQVKHAPNPTSSAIVQSSQSVHSSQRKVHAITIDNQPQQLQKQQSLQERSVDRDNQFKETATNIKSRSKRNHDQKKESVKQDEAAVTFAEHICIRDDDESDKFVFGFFDEKRQQPINQSKSNKITSKHNENSPVNNNKSNPSGQKHKLKHPKASLNSEQKRYKFNDNIDANSFNYHQILDFIRNSWESSSKSHHQ